MRYITVDAEHRTTYKLETPTIEDAMNGVGLSRRTVDHGNINRNVCVIVHEFGLFQPKDKQHYFIINGHLYAGNALLYQVNDYGETVDFDKYEILAHLQFMDGVAAEAGILAGHIIRPRLTVNDEVLWTWSNPPPADLAAEMGYEA